MRALLVELYITHGDREFDGLYLMGATQTAKLMRRGYLYAPSSNHYSRKLTKKALELIKNG